MEVKRIVGNGAFVAVNEAVANAVGFDRAGLLQVIASECYFNMSSERTQWFRDGLWWCSFAYSDLVARCPYWGLSKIRSMVGDLREADLIECRQKGQSAMWYAVRYDVAEGMATSPEAHGKAQAKEVLKSTSSVSESHTLEKEACRKSTLSAPETSTQDAEDQQARWGKSTSSVSEINIPLISREIIKESYTESRGRELEKSRPFETLSAATPEGLEVCDGDTPEERMEDAFSETDRTQYVFKMAHAHGINIAIGSAMSLAKRVWTELGEVEARNYIEVRNAEFASASVKPHHYARYMAEDLRRWKEKMAKEGATRSVGRDDEDLSFLDGL